MTDPALINIIRAGVQNLAKINMAVEDISASIQKMQETILATSTNITMTISVVGNSLRELEEKSLEYIREQIGPGYTLEVVKNYEPLTIKDMDLSLRPPTPLRTDGKLWAKITVIIKSEDE